MRRGCTLGTTGAELAVIGLRGGLHACIHAHCAPSTPPGLQQQRAAAAASSREERAPSSQPQQPWWWHRRSGPPW